MAEFPSPKGTPKRKRDDLATEQRLSATALSPSRPSTSSFSFQPPSLHPVKYCNELVEDGNSSPRTRVAQKFGDLALENNGYYGESGGGATSSSNHQLERQHQQQYQYQYRHPFANPKFSPQLPVFDFDGATGSSGSGEMQLDDDDDGATRKRIKFPEANSDAHAQVEPIVHTNGETSANATGLVPIDTSGHLTLQTAVDPAIVRTSKSSANGRLQKSYPSINRLSDSKSRSRKRAGTPPVPKRKTASESIAEEDAPIVDPVRAALTWHEDEITIYDPEDKDDDGTGINGIGFKPTPAIAYARAQKRRQQLAEYKKREESEARAKRNQRRREQLGAGAEMERNHPIVRVHFSDTEPTTVVMT
ncbi:hypothetical protein F5X99DRAFT_296687 [Biscogniauxia marginata]|nr:hypothetical protein F5X99DRAFT_296687 [Biscogniauxia marginata]